MTITLRVKDVMEKNVVFIGSEETVAQAIKKMLQTGMWSLVVEAHGLPEGVVTERDVLRRCVGKGLLPERVKVKEIMSSPLITIDPGSSLGEAMKTMVEKDVRRLFVVEGEKITGRVTQTGLFEDTINVMTELSSLTTQL